MDSTSSNISKNVLLPISFNKMVRVVSGVRTFNNYHWGQLGYSLTQSSNITFSFWVQDRATSCGPIVGYWIAIGY